MTNIISNSIVVVDVATNGGTTAEMVMVNMVPIYAGLAATVFAVVSIGTLLVWLRKSK